MTEKTQYFYADGGTDVFTMPVTFTGQPNVYLAFSPSGQSTPGPVTVQWQAWNRFKMPFMPAKGDRIEANYEPAAGSSAGLTLGDLQTEATSDAQMDSIKAELLAAIAAGGGGSGGPSAYPGEVKLFALTAGQALPDGWEVDASRQLDPVSLPIVPLLVGIANESTGVAHSMVQLGADTFVFHGATAFKRYRPMETATVTWETTYAYASIVQGYPPALVVLNGKIVCLGGRASSTSALSLAYEYDPTTKTYFALTNMPAALSLMGVAALDTNRILVVGGGLTGSSLPAGPVNTLYVYTRSTNSWQTLASTLTTAASAVRLAKLPSGNILVLGGMDGAGVGVGLYYIFDVATLTLGPAQTFTPPTGTLNWDSFCLRTARGAAFRSGPAALTEYDEATNTFAAMPTQFHPYSMTHTTELGVAAGYTYACDLVAGPYGHQLFPGYSSTEARPFVIANSGYMPTYRYLRKT